MQSASPYSGLESKAFWRNATSIGAPDDFVNYYQPKFDITSKMGVFTAGSCFAQHIGRNLRKADFNVLDKEPIPDFIDDSLANSFGYRLYSARFGNIYTVRQLRQLLHEAFEGQKIVDAVWTKADRFFDTQRPTVEPNGFETEEFLVVERARHLESVRAAIQSTDIFVFTLGLTEAWINSSTGEVFPTAPGTIAGQFDPDIYHFKNFAFPDVMEDFEYVRRLVQSINANVKFLLTVSPVPLTATATGRHVTTATNYSKSVLRAVCGSLEERYEDVDYFPSFEIVSHPQMYETFFEANRRSVTPAGVGAAMSTFLSAHGVVGAAAPTNMSNAAPSKKIEIEEGEDELVCEDVLLEAFSSKE
jgi:hypothetical protein